MKLPQWPLGVFLLRHLNTVTDAVGCPCTQPGSLTPVRSSAATFPTSLMAPDCASPEEGWARSARVNVPGGDLQRGRDGSWYIKDPSFLPGSATVEQHASPSFSGSLV